MGQVRKLPHLGLVPAAATLLIMAAWLAPANSAHAEPSSQVSPTPTAAVPPCAAFAEFDAANFSDPTNIDNEWLPLVTGRKLVLKGLVEGRHRRVVFVATDLTKAINGVRTRVMWNRDYQSGRLVEAQLAFLAQDDDGNVWSLGTYTEKYENGQLSDDPAAWIAGIAGAEAGVHVPGQPDTEAPEYVRGSAPELDFLDCAKVIAVDNGDTVCVPLDCYDRILTTEERSALDAGSGHQRKYHARDLGIVEITSVENPEGETLKLIKDAELTKNENLWAGRKAFALEEHAYETSEVYRGTSPAERLLDQPATTPTPTPDPPEATPEPEPTAEPTPEPDAAAEPTTVPQTAVLLVTPTPAVAPLRTVPAVALSSFETPRRPPRSSFLPSILPSILPSSGGLPDIASSPIGWMPLGLGLILLAAYGRSYLHSSAVRSRNVDRPVERPILRSSIPVGPSNIASARRQALERQEIAHRRRSADGQPRAKGPSSDR